MTIDYRLAREALVRSLRGEITDARVLGAICAAMHTRTGRCRSRVTRRSHSR